VQRRGNQLFPLVAGLATLLLAVVVGFQVVKDPVYETAVGEQRAILLSDGSRLTLNTNTRLAVDYGEKLRRIRLVHGEAMFEVAKNPHRPFIVQTETEQVRALGTTFIVRNDAERVDVTLIEGACKSRP